MWRARLLQIHQSRRCVIEHQIHIICTGSRKYPLHYQKEFNVVDKVANELYFKLFDLVVSGWAGRSKHKL